MKRTVSQLISLKFTFIALMMAGLFAFAPTESAMAQGSQVNTPVNSVPAGPYVDPATAAERVLTHIETIKPQAEFLTPSTQAYKTLQARIAFYFAILESLESGKTVQESIEAGLGIFKSDSYAVYEKTLAAEFKQEAIDILTP